MSPPPFLDAAAIAAALPPRAAADALERALRAGLDPEADPPRTSLGTAAGELLVMASSASGAVGVKLATVAPGNPARDLPRVQGVYVLFDPATLAPAALLDAAALTGLRTAAVSALAVRHAAAPGAARLLLFGTGPQAVAHVAALREERPIGGVDVVGREPSRTAAFAAAARAGGVPARAVPAAGVAAAVAAADIICCATTARTALFGGEDVAPHATVVALGSHEPSARELDGALLRRAAVVVESVATALREAGDVVLAVAEGALAPADLTTLAALVRGEQRRDPARPFVFKSVGMAWQDAVLAAEAARRGPA